MKYKLIGSDQEGKVRSESPEEDYPQQQENIPAEGQSDAWGFGHQKVRQPWVAGLLTILVIGLGQVYNGELGWGLIYYGGSLLLSIGNAFLMLILPFPVNFLSFFLIGIVYFLFIFFISWKTAKNLGYSYSLKSYNRVSVYVVCVLMAWYIINPIFSEIIKGNIVHAYRVVATSMVPTIHDGDHILVNELIYKFSAPRRGDVVVFKYPRNESQYFIKRVVGLPGETIFIHHSQCFINGERLKEDYIVHLSNSVIRYPELDNFGPLTLPPHCFFLMGDNRDWSMDSRSFGPVQEEKIIGKAFIIYWSGTVEQEIAWNRLGIALD